MADATERWLSVNELTPTAFAPYGEVLAPIAVGGQAAPAAAHHGVTGNTDAKLVLENGVPRIWVMQLPKVGLSFSRIARHRRVTQCLGSLDGREWFLSVAPPGDPADSARPHFDDITAFRIPPGYGVKLHVATWHAGPHFAGERGLFFNLEHLDTNVTDNHAVELGQQFHYRLA